ncbi:MAG: hypothetical protein ACYCS9_09655 [Candidatus Dormibacteria bacterium]
MHPPLFTAPGHFASLLPVAVAKGLETDRPLEGAGAAALGRPQHRDA